MSAFYVIHSTILDPVSFMQYAKAVPDTLLPFDGEIIKRGKLKEVVVGDHQHDAFGMLGFPDVDSARAWYQSAAYQKLLPLREKSAAMTVLLCEDPTNI